MNPDLYQRRISVAVTLSLVLHLVFLWCYAATPLTRVLAQLLSRPMTVRQLPKDQLKRLALRRPPPQLSFIEVDSAQASAQRPDSARFFSDRSSLAANPVPSNRSADIPKIEGRKMSQLETTTVRLASKTQPRPAAPPSPPTAQPPRVVARAQTPQSMTPPKPAEGITSPELFRRQQQAQAAASPAKTTETSSTVAQSKQQLQFAESSFGLRPAPGEMQQTDREIPTIASATETGVARHGPTALNVVGMPQGAYSKKMFAEIGRYWTQLLDRRYADGQPGRARLNFTLYPTGRVDHLKIAQNSASPILGELCQTAVLQCAPFDPWPEDLKLIGGDHLDISIDFNVYLYER
jgi:hypothetical protein